ncbi:MAG: type II toxin-antitoxin system VapC family toxin [Candidatus Electryonea clarkiae]|nr:type II toxin-antitoxin system VapC family toxin [Candidatus Electryonea clarkiae]MDP8288982.1 type II toxin-antitoxin system VapC family toxin [Candidatus Electryonea clarkiae]
MIALDTNVLLRFLVKDEEKQSQMARNLIERVSEKNEFIFISEIVLCEMVWVLSSSRGYNLKRVEIVDLLKMIFNTKQFAFSDADRIKNALELFNNNKGDFADFLIKEQAIAAGCKYVATFDRTLLATDGFREAK